MRTPDPLLGLARREDASSGCRRSAAHAVFDALAAIPPSQRTRPVHLVSKDTMAEGPLVMAHLGEVSAQIQAAVDSLSPPLAGARTRPAPGQDVQRAHPKQHPRLDSVIQIFSGLYK